LLAGGLPWAPLLAAAPSRGFKIGACDWSLDKRCDTAAFDVAKRIGLDGVQVDLGTPSNQMRLRRADVQAEFMAAAKRTGMAIASLAIVEMNAVPLKRDPRAARWLSDAVDVAKALRLKVVMPACFGAGDLDMSNTAEIDHLVRVLKDTAPKAEKHGVLIGVESYLSAEDNLRLLERVGSPAVKVYYDVGNSTDKGRDIYKEIRTLGGAICQFHFKDGRALLGKGRIDFRRVRQALDAIHYSGWIQIEAAAPHELIADYTAQRKFLKELFPATVPG
jgi:L-ribulose-5-phosphate 3-epimerase